MEIGLLIFPTDKGIQPVELGREAEACRFKSLWPKPDAALATMEKYAPLVAEFNG